MDQDNVISLRITGDVNALEAAMAQAVENVKSSLAAIKAEIRRNAMEVRIATPDLKPALREELAQMRWNAAEAERDLFIIGQQWKDIQGRIEQATDALREHQHIAETGKSFGGYALPEELVQESKAKVIEAHEQLQGAVTQGTPLVGQLNKAADTAAGVPRETAPEGEKRETVERQAVPIPQAPQPSQTEPEEKPQYAEEPVAPQVIVPPAAPTPGAAKETETRVENNTVRETTERAAETRVLESREKSEKTSEKESISKTDTAPVPPRFDEALRLAATSQTLTAAQLQQQLGVSRSESRTLMQALEAKGIVGPAIPFQPRQILTSGLPETPQTPAPDAPAPSAGEQTPGSPATPAATPASETETVASGEPSPDQDVVSSATAVHHLLEGGKEAGPPIERAVHTKQLLRAGQKNLAAAAEAAIVGEAVEETPTLSQSRASIPEGVPLAPELSTAALPAPQPPALGAGGSPDEPVPTKALAEQAEQSPAKTEAAIPSVVKAAEPPTALNEIAPLSTLSPDKVDNQGVKAPRGEGVPFAVHTPESYIGAEAGAALPLPTAPVTEPAPTRTETAPPEQAITRSEHFDSAVDFARLKGSLSEKDLVGAFDLSRKQAKGLLAELGGAGLVGPAIPFKPRQANQDAIKEYLVQQEGAKRAEVSGPQPFTPEASRTTAPDETSVAPEGQQVFNQLPATPHANKQVSPEQMATPSAEQEPPAPGSDIARDITLQPEITPSVIPQAAIPAGEAAPTATRKAAAAEPKEEIASATPAAPKLPPDLAGAKPRYGYGQRSFALDFEDDRDRAAYIAAQRNPSRRDADYVNFVKQHSDLDEQEIRTRGQEIKASLKTRARETVTPVGEEERLSIPSTFTPKPIPKAPEQAAQAQEISTASQGLEEFDYEPAQNAETTQAGGGGTGVPPSQPPTPPAPPAPPPPPGGGGPPEDPNEKRRRELVAQRTQAIADVEPAYADFGEKFTAQRAAREKADQARQEVEARRAEQERIKATYEAAIRKADAAFRETVSQDDSITTRTRAGNTREVAQNEASNARFSASVQNADRIKAAEKDLITAEEQAAIATKARIASETQLTQAQQKVIDLDRQAAEVGAEPITEAVRNPQAQAGAAGSNQASSPSQNQDVQSSLKQQEESYRETSQREQADIEQVAQTQKRTSQESVSEVNQSEQRKEQVIRQAAAENQSLWQRFVSFLKGQDQEAAESVQQSLNGEITAAQAAGAARQASAQETASVETGTAQQSAQATENANQSNARSAEQTAQRTQASARSAAQTQTQGAAATETAYRAASDAAKEGAEAQIQGADAVNQSLRQESLQVAAATVRHSELVRARNAAQKEYQDLLKATAQQEAGLSRQAAEGNASAAAALQELRDKLEAARQKQIQYTAAVIESSEALRGMGASGRASYAEISAIEGAMTGSLSRTEFSLARVLSSFKGLGPIIDAAFPIFAALGMIEILTDMAEKVHKLYEDYVELKDIEDQVSAVTERIGRDAEEAWQRGERALEQYLRRTGQGIQAAQVALKDLDQKPIDLQHLLSTKQIDTALKSLPETLRDQIKPVFENVLPADLDKRIALVKTKLEETTKEAKRLRDEQHELTGQVNPYGGEGGGFQSIVVNREAGQQEGAASIFKALLDDLQKQQVAFQNERKNASADVNDELAKKKIHDAQLADDALRASVAITQAPPQTQPAAAGSLTLPQAIARYEGFGASPNNIPTANNNPGDLLFTEFTKKYGAVAGPTITDKTTGEQRTFAKFPDAESGWKALGDLLKSSTYANLTLAQAIERFNGRTETNNARYTTEVSRLTGIAPNSPISSAPAAAPNAATSAPGAIPSPLDITQSRLQIWQPLLSQLDPNSQAYLEVQNKIASIKGRVNSEIVQQLRTADQNAYDDFISDHKRTLEEQIAFWEDRLTRESAYVERYRDIHNTIGKLRQQQDEERIRRDVQAENQVAESLVRPTGQPDRAAQLDLYNQILADARDNANRAQAEAEAQNAQARIAQIGPQNLQQQQRDAIKSDNEGIEAIRAAREQEGRKLSLQETVDYWKARVEAERDGGEATKDALDNAQKHLDAAVARLIDQQHRLEKTREEIARIASETKFQEQEEIVKAAPQLGIPSEKLGAQFGVAVPQLQKPSVAAQVFSLGGAGSDETKEARQLAVIHQQEYEDQLASLRREEQDVQNDVNKKLAIEEKAAQLSARFDRQKLQDQIQIMRAIEAEWRKLFEQIGQEFFRGINQWIAGQKTFAQAMAQSWNGIAMSVIRDIEMMTQKWIAEHILMAAVHKLLETRVIQDLTTMLIKHLSFLGLKKAADTAGDAQKIAAHMATNAAILASDAALTANQVMLAQTSVGLIAAAAAAEEMTLAATRVAIATGDAGLAAAGTFAWWSAVDPPVAPAMAAAAYAEGMGWAAMAALNTGGYVGADGMAMLHKDEVVINHPITQMLGKMAASGNVYNDYGNVRPANPAALSTASGAGGSAPTFQSVAEHHSTANNNKMHLHYAPTIHAGTNMSKEDFGKMLDDHAYKVGKMAQTSVRRFNH